MVALNPSTTVITTAGNVYIAPEGTPFPADIDTDPAASFVNLGYIEEGGPNITGLTRDVTKRYAWNIDAALRNTYGQTEPTVELELLQWEHETFEYFFGQTGAELAVIIDVIDGEVKYRWQFTRAQMSANGDISLVKDDFNRFPVKFDVLAASTGDVWVELLYPDGSRSQAHNDGTVTKVAGTMTTEAAAEPATTAA